MRRKCLKDLGKIFKLLPDTFYLYREVTALMMGRLVKIWNILSLLFVSSYAWGQDVTIPNVLLIVSDGHGIQDLGCYGNKIVKTPYLDELARKGTIMQHMFQASACYDANMSVLLTGLFSHASGQYGPSAGYSHFSVFPEIKSLQAILHGAGYQTARCGRFTLQANSVFAFDTIIGSEFVERSIYEQVEHCSKYLRHVTCPFFLCFNTADPDRSNDWAEDDPEKADLFGNCAEGYSGILPKHYSPEKLNLPDYLPEFSASRKEFSAYYQSITRMDLGLGRLFYWLKKTGKWDQTLIIYVSADAPAFPGVRNTLSDPGIRVPCIVKVPSGCSFIESCNTFTSIVDIFPTILDYCNIQAPDFHAHGKSFRLNLSARAVEEVICSDVFASQSYAELTAYYPMRMVRNKQYKLIWNCAWQLPFPLTNELQSSATFHGISEHHWDINGKHPEAFFHRTEFELFDLLEDPKELNNLMLIPGNELPFETLKVSLEKFMISTGDPWITKWNNK